MEDHTIIQAQTLLVLLFAFLLTIVSSYLLTSWMRRGERLEAAEPKPVFRPLARLRQITMYLKLNFHRAFQQQWATPKSSFLRDWLAPVIAWLAVLLMSIALVGLLLGEE